MSDPRDSKDAGPRPIVIVGPTAGGKSELAVALAEALGGEVINADSMQVYRHMDAGTAKPAADLRRRVPHHLIDIVEPTERFTVADWLERAESLLAEFRGRNLRGVIVGGTNLYLKALLEGMFEGPAIDHAYRQQLAQRSPQELHDELRRVDPVAAGRIHPNDHKRLTRALEVFHLTGKPISELQQQWIADAQPAARGSPTPAYRHNPILIGLDWPTDAINRRINARVKEMFWPSDGSESLPDEVRRLEAGGLLGPQARKALGYQQVLDALAGRCTLDDAFEQTKIQTRRFAKTQRTWLKRYRGVHWLPAAELAADELAQRAIDIVREND